MTKLDTKISLLIIPAALLGVAILNGNISVMPQLDEPEIVSVSPGSFMYRESGEHLKGGVVVNAPLVKVQFIEPLHIMKYQVLVGDYEACVKAEACSVRLRQGRYDPSLPVTGISYIDAMSYSIWLSKNTNTKWRLPTDQEWVFAAGSRFLDYTISPSAEKKNPAKRWLEDYKKYSQLKRNSDATIKPPGAYGRNENGIYDMAGNIWEWTESCYRRVHKEHSGVIKSVSENCGVRIAEGQHRTYASNFIQDAKGGGCSVGFPPDHFGIRLVKTNSRSGLNKFSGWLGL